MNKQATEAETTVTYTLSLTVTRPVRVFNYDDTLDETAAWMVSKEAKRELENEVLQALRKLDGDCDIEVMDVAIAKATK